MKIRFEILMIFIISFANNVNSAITDDFLISIKTDNLGVTQDTEFLIPASIINSNDYNVDCNNDGIDEATAVQGSFLCDYSSLGGEGSYTIRIKDNSGAGVGFPTIRFEDTDDKLKLISIDQWGTGKWKSMQDSFFGCENLVILASDVPDFSQVISMRRMFSNASMVAPNTRFWNVSSVENMHGMFQFTLVANPDTSLWNVSSVTIMSHMFLNTTSANPDTSNWDVSSVMNMGSIFENALAANPDTSNWDVSSVILMGRMFVHAGLANPDTSNWEVSSVVDMRGVFFQATSATPNTSNWDVSSVKDMTFMFAGATIANPDTSNWDVSSVTSMRGMFSNTINANPDTSNWDVSSVTDMTDMFLSVTLPTNDYDRLITGFNSQNLQFGIAFSGGNSKYCVTSVHDNLTDINTGHGWIVSDGGMDNCFAQALGTSNPLNLTPLQIQIPEGGNGTTKVTFFEINNQGVNIDDLNCSLNDGTALSIISPINFPVTIPQAGSVDVVVYLSDANYNVDPTDLLKCSFTDLNGFNDFTFPIRTEIQRIMIIPMLNFYSLLALFIGFFYFGFFKLKKFKEIN